jgi:hypothetical protein
MVPGVWSIYSDNDITSSTTLYSLSISSTGAFELWERSQTPEGSIVHRGMGGTVAPLSASSSSTNAITLRFVKAAERLVWNGGDISSQCEPQTADIVVQTVAARTLVMEISAFSSRLVFWRNA